MLRPILDPIHATGSFLRPCLWLLVMPVLPVLAQTGEGWRTLGQDRGDRQVRLKCPPNCEIRSDRPFVVITHGMNGTSEGDRFHLLGESIGSSVSDANVVLIDWSEASCASWIPMFVAWSINSIADEACEDLCDLGFQADQATLIGESFGNYVNARIATNFGKVDHLIAMNPASELGGYAVPDLRSCSRVSWSFHTYSLFDTLQRIAHRCIIIQTPPEANDLERHTAGIRRLVSLLVNGHRLMPPEELRLSADRDCFDALWTVDGSFKPTLKKRTRPTPESFRGQSPSMDPAARVPVTQGTDVRDRAIQALTSSSLARR